MDLVHFGPDFGDLGLFLGPKWPFLANIFKKKIMGGMGSVLRLGHQNSVHHWVEHLPGHMLVRHVPDHVLGHLLEHVLGHILQNRQPEPPSANPYTCYS